MIGARVLTKQVDSTCRTGYALVGAKPKTPQEMASEYYMVGELRILFEEASYS
jgi:polyamine oxidase